MKVTVYTKPDCPQCKMVKFILAKEQINYEEKDIIADPADLEYIKDLGYRTVPITIKEGSDPIIGFQPEKLKALK